jgi:hypothetical protein
MTDAAYTRHWTTGMVLSIVAIVCLAFAIFNTISAAFIGTLFFSIPALIVGNIAFSEWEKAYQLRPIHLEPIAIPIQSTDDTDAFCSTLKNGTEVFISFQIHSESVARSPDTLIRLKAEILRSLQATLPSVESLPVPPFSFMDTIVKADAQHLSKQLQIDNLSCRCFKVQLADAPSVRLKGIFGASE